MNDTTVPRQGATGSISGFNPITQVDGSILEEYNFSIAQLRAYILELDALNAPYRLRMIEKTIMDHVRNFGNPHRDTIDQLSPDLVSSLLVKYAPGTVPRTFPLTAIEAAFEELDTSLSSVTVVRDGEINVIDRQGFLKYVGANTIGVDWSHGYPILPCWPAKQQLFTTLDLSVQDSSQTFSLINVIAAEQSQNGIVPLLMNQQTTLFETNVQAQFGIAHTMPNIVIGSEYTFSIFVYPNYTKGSYIYKTTAGEIAAVRLSDGGVIESTNIKAYVYQLPNGWWRIGFQYIADPMSVSSINQLIFCPSEFADLESLTVSSLVYIGKAGNVLAVMYGPQLTTGAGVAPFTQSGSIAATTISSPGFDSATLTNTGMMAVRYNTADSLLPGQADALITIASDLTVTVGNRTLTSVLDISTPPITTTAAYDSDTLSVYALSYDKTGVSMQCSGSEKITVSSQNRSFVSLATMTDIVFGSFCGGLCAAEFYAISDDDAALEFLVGEP